MTDAGRWFKVFRPRAGARARLVCLAHAGGSAAAFRGWAELLPPEVELLALRYPGRLDRFGEPVPESMGGLVAEVVAALLPLDDLPLTLLGHSMGAVVAYEATALLERRHALTPRLLVVSGREAPSCAHPEAVSSHDDDALLARFRALGSIGPDVFADPDLRELLLPILRADCRLMESYRPDPAATVATPIVAYVGDRDPGCSVAQARAWAAATTGPFELRVFPGDHFYFASCLAEVTRDLSERVLPPAARGKAGEGRS
ncbi:MAG TPA: alpha/beta fold hydrolase [Candidatus Eisenbacteria bacterium]|nr:alpha/beta fold hydrolase [Candidatus Eisenbacteria bacterium]